MAGRPSARLIAALHLLLDNIYCPPEQRISAYACAKRADLKPDTIYRSRLYKQYLELLAEPDATRRRTMLAALNAELVRPPPRQVSKKPHAARN